MFRVLKTKQTSVPNMIPTIDILFQLVIFFMLACQFSVMEQFPIPLPENCANAAVVPASNTITVTIINTKDPGRYELAVGAQKVATGDGKELADKLLSSLDAHFAGASSNEITVSLRFPRDMPFKQTQHILAAVGQSPARKIQMSVLRESDFSNPQ